MLLVETSYAKNRNKLIEWKAFVDAVGIKGTFFQTVASIHSYNTGLASKSTCYINAVNTNHGKFNIRFAPVKVCNHLDKRIKHLPIKTFEKKVKLSILQSYCSWCIYYNSIINFSFSLFFLSSFIYYLVLLSLINFLVILSKCCLNLYSYIMP